MNKLLILFFLLVLINLVNADQDIATFSILRDSYTAKETLQAQLLINVDLVNEVQASNFVLTDMNNNLIPIPLFLEKISKNSYFVYFNIPEIAHGQYNFQVNDLRYIENSILKQVSIKKQFNILNKTLDNTSISIDPGIILKDSKLEITNNLDPINVTIESVNLSRTFLLNDKMSFDIKVNKEDYNVKIYYNNKQYTIPVLNLNKDLINQSNVILTIPKNSIIFLNSSFGKIFPDKISLNKNVSLYNPIYVKNTWGFSISNITFVITGNLKEILKLNENRIESIKENETIEKIIIINENKNPLKDNYQGSIVIISNQDIISNMNFNINFIEKNVTLVTNIINKTINQTKNPPYQIKPEKKSSFIKIVVIIFIIVLVIYFIFKRKIKKSESFEEHFFKKD